MARRRNRTSKFVIHAFRTKSPPDSRKNRVEPQPVEQGVTIFYNSPLRAAFLPRGSGRAGGLREWKKLRVKNAPHLPVRQRRGPLMRRTNRLKDPCDKFYYERQIMCESVLHRRELCAKRPRYQISNCRKPVV